MVVGMPQQQIGQAGAVLAVGGVLVLGLVAVSVASLYFAYYGARHIIEKKL